MEGLPEVNVAQAGHLFWPYQSIAARCTLCLGMGWWQRDVVLQVVAGLFYSDSHLFFTGLGFCESNIMMKQVRVRAANLSHVDQPWLLSWRRWHTGWDGCEGSGWREDIGAGDAPGIHMTVPAFLHLWYWVSCWRELLCILLLAYITSVERETHYRRDFSPFIEFQIY